MLQGQIVVLSIRRASGHLRSLFKTQALMVMFEYLWESNSQEITGLIVNLYLYTFLIDRFFVFLTVFFFWRNFKKPLIHFMNGLAVASNRLRVYRLELKIVRLCILKQRLIWIHFSFRKASVVNFLSIFIDKTWQLRKYCVNKHMYLRAETEFSLCNARIKFSQVCF